MLRAGRTVLLGLGVAVALAGCAGSGSGSGDRSGAAPTSSAATSTIPPAGTTVAQTAGTVRPEADPRYYVAIGDSYAAGYQPTAAGNIGHTTRQGYVFQTVHFAAARGYRLTLVDFGCAGATTVSVRETPGCPPGANAPGAGRYSAPQIDAAAAFLRAHRGHIALVTITLGGNDLTSCNKRHLDLGTCLPQEVVTIRSNLAGILSTLRSAAGGSAPIVGTTYPDFLLGADTMAGADARGLAAASVPFFRDQLNPVLRRTYGDAGAVFLDLTAAFGAYGPITAKTTLAPYGSIPVPVARICTLTYFCQFQDIHPRTNGYALIARLVAGTLPRR